MRIKLVTIYAGPDGGFQPGDIVDWPAKRAQPLVDGGYAVLLDAVAVAEADEEADEERQVDDAAEIETATITPTERATGRRQR